LAAEFVKDAHTDALTVFPENNRARHLRA